MNENEILCLCMGVTRADIVAAIAGGAQNLGQVRMLTHCATSCGMCADKIRAEVEELFRKTGDDHEKRSGETECTKR